MEFITSARINTEETIEKRSRFIADLVPILKAADAETALAEIRERHKGANHHCFAYRCGLGVPVERFSDDGEPSGTAGRPILEVIRRQGMDNVLVVVTRYFGGVLLGANGLIRAYTQAASEVLTSAPKLVCAPMQTLQVTCDYAIYGKLEYNLQQINIPLYEKTFNEAVSFELVVPEKEVEKTLEQLTEWTNGQITVAVSSPEYIGVAPDGSLVRGVWPEGMS